MLHHQLVTDLFVSHAVQTGQPVVRQPSAREGRFKVKTAYMVQGLINMPICSTGAWAGYWRSTIAAPARGSANII